MAKSFDLETSPGHLLRRANQFANDLYTNEQDSKLLTPRQFAVLFAVDREEGMSQTELVEATGIDRSTLADMIVRMQKKDLLARKRTEEDARANAVKITPTGRRALRAVMSAMLKAEQRFLEELPARLRPEFVKCLSILSKAANNHFANGDGSPKGRKRR